jgi:hypothetical protein
MQEQFPKTYLLAYLNFVIYFLEGDGVLMENNVQLLKSSKYCFSAVFILFYSNDKGLKTSFCISLINRYDSQLCSLNKYL